jgi:hypothetical protein
MSSKSKRRCPLVVAAALLAGVGLPGATAVAQVPATITSPQEIAACLCLERSIGTLASEMLARQRIYEEKRRQLEQLETEVATKRAQVNVTDTAQVDAFRALLDRRNQAQAEFQAQVAPEYVATVDTYNRQVADFNAGCVNRGYDNAVLTTVRANLVCPAP